jgi:transcriptional regulator with XRE-family HTH domain
MPRTRPSVQAQRGEEARAVGRRLAETREAAGMSQLEVARRLGVPQSSIAKLELGQRQLRFVDGLRLAAVYRVPPSTFAPEDLIEVGEPPAIGAR